MSDLPPSARRVADAAAELCLSIDVVAFPEGTRTAGDAARAVGCELGQIVKSLLFVVGGDPVLALVSGANRLDERKLLGVVAARRSDAPPDSDLEVEVERADANLVREVTGYAVGGVPPFGHPTPLPTFVDLDLLRYEVVWAAAGTPTHVFSIDPAELTNVIGAQAVDLAAQ